MVIIIVASVLELGPNARVAWQAGLAPAGRVPEAVQSGNAAGPRVVSQTWGQTTWVLALSSTDTAR